MAVESFFLNPGGLVFLSLLIPLLLLYLIKPKPLRKTIPSLMFILNDTGRNKINRLFQNWMTDILLLFHFLIIALLALSIAQPYVEVPQSLFVQESIIIIDVSASMSVGDRWDDAKDIARDSLSERNTIILARSFPELYADGVIASRAKRMINELEPQDTTTNLADALKLANVGPSTQVTIISDFLPSAGSLDLQAQIDAIESKGALVQRHVLGSPTENVGIIDLRVRDDESKVWVKNFADRPRDATVRIGGEEETLVLGKGETKELSFATPEGVTEITIKEKDDFMLDNKIYISTPDDNEIEALIFTNNKEAFERSNLKLALGIIEQNFPVTFEFEYAIFPKVPDLNHDMYVFYEVNPSLIIPGYINDLKEQVEGGAGFIVAAQDGLFSIDFQGLLGIEYQGEGGAAELVAPDENIITKDISFGQVQKYDQVTVTEGHTIIATANEDPIITLSKFGEGTILYYGLREGMESFSSENSFPVFWRRVFDFATNRPTLRSLNVETGSVISFPKEERVKTPTDRLNTKLLRADNAGLYVLSDRTIAANLLSDLESNVNRQPVVEAVQEETEGRSEKKLPKDLANTFIIIGLIIMLFELIYIKFRGDL